MGLIATMTGQKKKIVPTDLLTTHKKINSPSGNIARIDSASNTVDDGAVTIIIFFSMHIKLCIELLLYVVSSSSLAARPSTKVCVFLVFISEMRFEPCIKTFDIHESLLLLTQRKRGGEKKYLYFLTWREMKKYILEKLFRSPCTCSVSTLGWKYVCLC